MTNKLPAYFENYLEEKFESIGEKLDKQSCDLGGRMDSLKNHVNDEIQRSLFFLQKLERAARNGGNTELAKKVMDVYTTHATKFGYN